MKSINEEKYISYTISDLQDMNIREFNLLFKNLTVKEMKWIIFDNGIWVKSNLKSREIQELFLDMVDGIVVSTEQDRIKIQKSIKRKNKTKAEVVLTGIDLEIEELYKFFKEKKFKAETISSYGYILTVDVVKNMEIEDIENYKKEMKTKSRKMYLKIHPDKAVKEYSKYTKQIACFTSYFRGVEKKIGEHIEYLSIINIGKEKEKNKFF